MKTNQAGTRRFYELATKQRRQTMNATASGKDSKVGSREGRRCGGERNSSMHACLDICWPAEAEAGASLEARCPA